MTRTDTIPPANNSAGAAPVRIDIVSDPVCPWCYVGKRRLERALNARPDVAADIHWLPYQLSPDMPREGKDRATHYATIFGAERAREIMENMARTAAGEGLRFETKPGARSPNTLAAHVLLDLAERTEGIDSSAVAERLFVAHHADSEDIGSTEVLVRIGAEAGLDPATVRDVLDKRSGETAVRARIEEARQAGVSGVPFFIFEGRYALSGAQPPEVFQEVLDKVLAERTGGMAGVPADSRTA